MTSIAKLKILSGLKLQNKEIIVEMATESLISESDWESNSNNSRSEQEDTWQESLENKIEKNNKKPKKNKSSKSRMSLFQKQVSKIMRSLTKKSSVAK